VEGLVAQHYPAFRDLRAAPQPNQPERPLAARTLPSMYGPGKRKSPDEFDRIFLSDG
jgi:hypothetical protein